MVLGQEVHLLRRHKTKPKQTIKVTKSETDSSSRKSVINHQGTFAHNPKSNSSNTKLLLRIKGPIKMIRLTKNKDTHIKMIKKKQMKEKNMKIMNQI